MTPRTRIYMRIAAVRAHPYALRCHLFRCRRLMTEIYGEDAC